MQLADIILAIHFLFVLFVVGSLPLIWIGAWLHLKFVRSLVFRLTHLAAILFVVGESLIGIICPLTRWEYELRGIEAERSFIQYWLHRMLYYDFPEGVLTASYVVFAFLVVITFKFVPPVIFRKFKFKR
ncbi:DUF2784 domain-containing protein [Nitrosomonas sp. Is37]|uniref:DUF2784 domain-containing protein n=1 Tax=Nitrosomonas sp. Is37 TaxID=3080535 RepID=UPI00294A9E3D|nr:DUF2784 domain-containing protein [Nitrosomonas sp. Is37]MDV6343125.1 DUF2784 domain-containing protein [Nitrosomonas sp. Is37]